MAPTATEPKKTKKPPNLFTVKGDSSGIKTQLSSFAKSKICGAAEALNLLAEAGETFPKADALSAALLDFIERPTAKE